MLFNSQVFAIFVAIVFALYYLPALRRAQVTILLVASFVFYSWHNPYLLLLLIVSLLINGATSYGIIHSGSLKHQRKLAVAGVTLNLLILIFFKYSGLFAKTLVGPSNDIGAFLINLPLPIGISFFTFQGISLVVDLFKGEKISRRYGSSATNFRDHLISISFFISFFPQLVAGPIVKAHEFLPQVKSKYFSEIQWNLVAREIITGYFLKSFIADNLKEFTGWIHFPEFQLLSSLTLLVLLFGYSMQIFADFAGYSLIAIGLSRLFGYNLRDNFNFPYIARSFSEFWRRWHISLSSFLRDYLYIPLGGNRLGRFRTYFNLFITMVLGGLWHGAAWSYAVWGLFHGLVLAIERFFKNNVINSNNSALRALYGLVVFSGVTFAWLLFQLPNFSEVIAFIRSLTTNLLLPSDYKSITNIIIYSTPVILYHVVYLAGESSGRFRETVVRYEYMPLALMLFLTIVNSGPATAFIYFQF